MIHYKEITKYIKVWLKTEDLPKEGEYDEWEYQEVELIAAEIGSRYYKREELPEGMAEGLLAVLGAEDTEGWEYF